VKRSGEIRCLAIAARRLRCNEAPLRTRCARWIGDSGAAICEVCDGAMASKGAAGLARVKLAGRGRVHHADNGLAFSISAMLTVNSSPPLAKPRVPSSGSTQKKRAPHSGMRPSATASSPIIGTPGASVARPASMIASAR
jgi:hypothetical protein